jgi:hypothetical protein
MRYRTQLCAYLERDPVLSEVFETAAHRALTRGSENADLEINEELELVDMHLGKSVDRFGKLQDL